MARRTIQGSRAIVTGASSGIGRAIAAELARQGADLVITARREDRLRDLAQHVESDGRRVELVAGDITDPAIRERVLDAAVTRLGGLDVLVNNAGVGGVGLFEDASPDRLRRIMEVDFFALVEMIRIALPALKNGRKPIVVNVSSVLGHRAIPYCAEYCASKFAVRGFSESLRAELVRHGIDLLVVSPGTTETEFFDNVVERTAQPPWSGGPAVSPEKVARKTVRAIRRGRHEIVPFIWGRLLILLNRLSPRLMDSVMARY